MTGLEERIGYEFRDPSLLTLALTHSSYANEGGTRGRHNERLEYLGDAALELITSDLLYHKYPGKSEGNFRSSAQRWSAKRLWLPPRTPSD